MKRVMINEHSVELTDESLHSFIKSKVNACDREVKYEVTLNNASDYRANGLTVVALVERWTRDRKVTGSTPGRSAIKSTRSTQPSIPPG